jgi:molybdopterin converting factor small subunit
MNTVEVRGFGVLLKLFKERHWPVPVNYELKESITAAELAEALEFPKDKIEVVLVNGLASSLDHQVKPGDRIAFVPPGTPGPYRVILGFVQNKQKA